VTGLPKKRYGNGDANNEKRVNVLIHFQIRFSDPFFTTKEEIKNDQTHDNIERQESHFGNFSPPPPPPPVNIISEDYLIKTEITHLNNHLATCQK
jgi:hypothetical protein